MDTTDLIAGEPRSTLVEALAQFRYHRTPSTMVRIHGEIGPDLAGPFLRALYRVEGELLSRDTHREVEDRSPEQLAADTFVELVSRLVQARIRGAN